MTDETEKHKKFEKEKKKMGAIAYINGEDQTIQTVALCKADYSTRCLLTFSRADSQVGWPEIGPKKHRNCSRLS